MRNCVLGSLRTGSARACCSYTVCTPDEEGLHGRYADNTVTACALPCNLVQAQRPRPRISAPCPITLGAIVCDRMTPVPPGWYGKLCSSSVVLHVKFEWSPNPLVLDCHESYFSTFGQHIPVSCHKYISASSFLNSL